MRIAVTGANGNLGSQLVLMGCIPMECDVTQLSDVINTLSMIKPDVVINCAAKTNVDECETIEGWKRAVAVNVHGVENLRNVFQGRLIHSFHCRMFPQPLLPECHPVLLFLLPFHNPPFIDRSSIKLSDKAFNALMPFWARFDRH
jgi:nucleoside-diphosphate-sugar epimerase